MRELVDDHAVAVDCRLAGFVDINDNATARAGMSSLMVSATIERVAGIESIPHLTTLDLRAAAKGRAIAVSATDEPEMQPNSVLARMLTSARPPRIASSPTMRPPNSPK